MKKKLELLNISAARHVSDRSPHNRFDYPQLFVVSWGIYREAFLGQRTTAHGMSLAALLINH